MELSGYLYIPTALAPPRKIIPVPIEEETGWAIEPIWTFGDGRNLLPLPVFGLRTVQAVTYDMHERS